MSVPVIKATSVERIVHPDGRVDIIVHAPKLELTNAIAKKKKEQDNGIRNI